MYIQKLIEASEVMDVLPSDSDNREFLIVMKPGLVSWCEKYLVISREARNSVYLQCRGTEPDSCMMLSVLDTHNNELLNSEEYRDAIRDAVISKIYPETTTSSEITVQVDESEDSDGNKVQLHKITVVQDSETTLESDEQFDNSGVWGDSLDFGEAGSEFSESSMAMEKTADELLDSLLQEEMEERIANSNRDDSMDLSGQEVSEYQTVVLTSTEETTVDEETMDMEEIEDTATQENIIESEVSIETDESPSYTPPTDEEAEIIETCQRTFDKFLSDYNEIRSFTSEEKIYLANDTCFADVNRTFYTTTGDYNATDLSYIFETAGVHAVRLIRLGKTSVALQLTDCLARLIYNV